MKNNKKTTSWNHNLVATAGFLSGLVVTSLSVSIVGVYNVTMDPVRFVAQQFISNTPVNNGGLGGGGLAGPNVGLNPNQIAPNPAPVNPWTFFFNFVMQNALQNNIVAPTCDVVGSVVAQVAPGVIDYAATTNPAVGVVSICGILNHATNQVVAVAPFNALAAQFVNLLPGEYDLVCLTKLQNKPRKLANFCMDGTFDIIDPTQVNPIPPVNPNPNPNPNPPPAGPTTTTPAPAPTIDLEVYADVFPSQGAPGTPGIIAYKFKVVNNPANANSAADNFTLRVYSQGLTNITAPGAVQTGPVTIWKIGTVPAGGTAGFFLQGTPGAGLNVVAELCDYANDGDSTECNMVNLVPFEDDEVKA